MPSARSVLRKQNKRIFQKRWGGPTSKAEKVFMEQFVANHPQEVTPIEVRALTKLLHRTPQVTKRLLTEARDKFIASAGHYVDVHKQAIDTALANGDPKSLEVAVRGSQWAMENASEGSTRIVDKSSPESAGPRVLVGIKIGGLNDAIEVKNDV